VNDARTAGGPPAVAGAARPRWGSVTIRDRGRLPHWEVEGGTYFITFRLFASLPKRALAEIGAEQQRLQKQTKRLTQAEHLKLQRAAFAKLEAYLDAGTGACVLRDARVAATIVENLKHFEAERYRLFAWCVMPNHVHVALKMFPKYSLQRVVQSWKSFTSKKANALLDRNGAFWQREYFDRLIRDESELRRVISYIAKNPENAGLRNWKWVEICGPAARGTAGQRPALRGGQ
jgi:REP element-mobilizing transposase RayT